MNYQELINKIDKFAIESDRLIKSAFIRKIDNKYKVLSESGKNLGVFDSKEKAEKRLKQIEFFKHKDLNNADDSLIVDLKDIEEISYSAIMRKLNKKYPKLVAEFMFLFKKNFDEGICDEVHEVETYAIKHTLLELNKKYKLKIRKDFLKIAQTNELGDPKIVGRYLADIVKFVTTRISPTTRNKSIQKLKSKIYYLSEHELSQKKLPASSSLGQSITFIKHVLFNHDARYIREVLNSIVRHL